MAPVAEAAANSDPIVVFIMRLFAAAAMTDDGVLAANGAAAHDDLGAGLGPIGFEVVLCGRKWDKQNRSAEGFARPVTLPKIDWAGAKPFLLDKSQLEKNNAATSPLLACAAGIKGCFQTEGRQKRQLLPGKDWPVNWLMSRN